MKNVWSCSLDIRYNKSFVHTFIKIKAIEQKTEATLLISRLNPFVRRSLMFRTANGGVLPGVLLLFLNTPNYRVKYGLAKSGCGSAGETKSLFLHKNLD